MHIPGPIYEAIPVVYLACAISSVFIVDAPYSVISAILFGYASWMVWKMRKDYRNRPPEDIDIDMGAT